MFSDRGQGISLLKAVKQNDAWEMPLKVSGTTT